MSEWISVEDRIPDDFEGVLGYLDKPIKHGRRIAMCIYCEGRCVSVNGGTWPKMPTPTHWMPLPQPPETTQ